MIPILLTMSQLMGYKILVLAETFSLIFPKANQEIHTEIKELNLLLKWYFQSKSNNL